VDFKNNTKKSKQQTVDGEKVLAYNKHYDKENIPAAQEKPKNDPRLPFQNENARRPPGDQQPEEKRKETACSLSG